MPRLESTLLDAHCGVFYFDARSAVNLSNVAGSCFCRRALVETSPHASTNCSECNQFPLVLTALQQWAYAATGEWFNEVLILFSDVEAVQFGE